MKKKTDEQKTGFLKCKVLPPQKLFPVLPSHFDKKLLFVLCNKCAILKNHVRKCKYLENERALKGTWCLHEIYEALEENYKILENDIIIL